MRSNAFSGKVFKSTHHYRRRSTSLNGKRSPEYARKVASFRRPKNRRNARESARTPRPRARRATKPNDNRRNPVGYHPYPKGRRVFLEASASVWLYRFVRI